MQILWCTIISLTHDESVLDEAGDLVFSRERYGLACGFVYQVSQWRWPELVRTGASFHMSADKQSPSCESRQVRNISDVLQWRLIWYQLPLSIRQSSSNQSWRRSSWLDEKDTHPMCNNGGRHSPLWLYINSQSELAPWHLICIPWCSPGPFIGPPIIVISATSGMDSSLQLNCHLEKKNINNPGIQAQVGGIKYLM